MEQAKRTVHPSIIFVVVLFCVSRVFAGPEMPPMPPPDDFPNFLMLLALCAAAVMCALLGIGIVLAVFTIGCAAMLTAMGVFSTSILIATLRRRVSAGIRAMHYQVMALLGLPCGIGAAFILPRVTQFKWSTAEACILGGIGGIVAGLTFGFLLDAAASFIRRRFLPSVR